MHVRHDCPIHVGLFTFVGVILRQMLYCICRNSLPKNGQTKTDVLCLINEVDQRAQLPGNHIPDKTFGLLLNFWHKLEVFLNYLKKKK